MRHTPVRVSVLVAATPILAVGGCVSLPALPDWGFRSIIYSDKPSPLVSTCIADAWRKSFPAVRSVAGARENEIRVEDAGGVAFEADVIAQSAGSTIIYTTPYGLVRPVGHSFEDAQLCARK